MGCSTSSYAFKGASDSPHLPSPPATTADFQWRDMELRMRAERRLGDVLSRRSATTSTMTTTFEVSEYSNDVQQHFSLGEMSKSLPSITSMAGCSASLSPSLRTSSLHVHHKLHPPQKLLATTSTPCHDTLSRYGDLTHIRSFTISDGTRIIDLE